MYLFETINYADCYKTTSKFMLNPHIRLVGRSVTSNNFILVFGSSLAYFRIYCLIDASQCQFLPFLRIIIAHNYADKYICACLYVSEGDMLDLCFACHYLWTFFFLLSTERSNFKGPGIKKCIFVAWPSWNRENNNSGRNNIARSETWIKDPRMCCFEYCGW